MHSNATAVGIIGGTGLNSFAQGLVQGPVITPFGDASAALVRSESAQRPVLFLARHGSPHSLAPDKINYRANLWALKNQGVQQVLAVNAVGGIRSDLTAGTLVIPDQLVDYSHGREHSYFDGRDYPGFDNALQHVDFTFPYSVELAEALAQAADRSALKVVRGGVYAAVQGPRLETAAEINRLEGDGCDMVGMTGMPEAALARELGMDYASICLVVNPAAGRSQGLISMEQIHQVIDSGMVEVRLLLDEVLKTL